MPDRKQLITIKGTRDGLTLFIDDSCSYEDAYAELRNKIAENKYGRKAHEVSVKVNLGNRYLHKTQKEKLRQLISTDKHLAIHSFESNVIPRKEALAWKERSDVKTVNRIVRSGQVLDITGDLLLIGDVNPGGKVSATGNIYVLGRLSGIAHAGYQGDRSAVIAASFMKPGQLRIADCISRAPDYDSDGVFMECGLIDEATDKIVIDRLQTLSDKRKDLSSFERRMLNG